MHSLARYSKRTIQLFQAVSHCPHQISGSFDSLSRVLFNIPSQYWCAIGFEEYLRLEVDASLLQTQCPMSPTQDTSHLCCFSRTGLSPCIVCRSRQLLLKQLRGLMQGLVTPHVLPVSRKIRFALCCVRSLLLAASHLISFPPGTETFHFPGFWFLAEHSMKSAKSHSGISGSMATCASPEHFVACHALRPLSNRVIRLTGFEGLYVRSFYPCLCT